MTISADHNTAGLTALKKEFPKASIVVIGPGGIALEKFFSRPVMDWF